jgi:WD40 repeat protein
MRTQRISACQLFGLFILLRLLSPAVAADSILPMLDTTGHMAVIKGVAFTPDMKLLVSAGNDKVIRIWDWRSGNTVRTIRGASGPGPDGKILALALSPNGRWLAAGGTFGAETATNQTTQDVNKVRLYDFQSGKLVALLPGHTNIVLGLAFSADSTRLISGSSDATSIIWEVPSGKLLLRLHGHKDDIYAVGLLPDNQRAVTGSYDNTVKLWDIVRGRELATLTGHRGMVRALAVSANGRLIASGTRDETGEIKLWDGATGRLLRSFKNQAGVGSLTFTPDGRQLISSCGRYCKGAFLVRVWDVATGKELRAYKNHDDTVLAASISRDGRFVASAGGSNNEIHIWDLRTAKSLQVLRGTGAPNWAAAFSDQSDRIAWGTKNPCPEAVSCPGTQASLQYSLTIPGPGRRLGRPERFSGNEASGFLRSRSLVSDWSLIHRKGGKFGYNALLDIIRGGTTAATIERTQSDGFEHLSYSFNIDGTSVISGGRRGVLQAYSTAGTPTGEFVGHEGEVWAIAPSPDGRLLLSASDDQTLRLWNINTRELVASLFNSSDGEWVMWTPQGYYTSSPNGDRFVGWQINKGEANDPEFYTARQLKSHFYRPDIVERAIVLASAVEAIDEARRIDPEHLNFALSTLLDRKPPSFSVVTPADGTEISTSNTGIRIEFGKATEPITNLELFVNSSQVASQQRGLVPVTTPSDVSDIVVPIGKGPNRIAIRVSNAVGTVEKEITLFGTVPGDLDKAGRLFVIAIGVDDYPALPPRCRGKNGSCNLAFAGADARAFQEQIINATNGMYKDVKSILLTNKEGPTHQPTAANIIDAFDLLRQSTEKDTVAVFLSGHGMNEDVHGRKEYLFLPTDTRFSDDGAIRASSVVSWAVLQQGVGKALGRRLLFVDTCHAANAYNYQLVKNAYDDNIAVFSAVDRDNEAQERDTLGHGVFTHVILRGLQGEAAQKREVRLLGFADFVDRVVRELTNESQQPEINIQHMKNFVLAHVR